MAKAKKLPSGNWRCRIYVNTDTDGKKHYKSFTAKTKKEAEYLASQYAIDERESINHFSLDKAMSLYIESKNNVLSPTTIATYKNTQKNHLKSLMHLDINDITAQMIQREINEETKKSSPKTIKNIHGLLSAVMHEFRPDFHFNTKLPQKERSTIRIPTKEELEFILQNSDGELEIAVALAAYEGLRRSEICALTWDEIDLKNKTITIKKALVMDENYEAVIKVPKSYSGNRVIPIFDPMLHILETVENKSGYLVTLKPLRISQQYAKLLKKINISGVRFHDLRHYFASVMLALNVPDKYAMELMGHATNTMLKTVYQHTMEEKSKEIHTVINQYFSKV